MSLCDNSSLHLSSSCSIHSLANQDVSAGNSGTFDVNLPSPESLMEWKFIVRGNYTLPFSSHRYFRKFITLFKMTNTKTNAVDLHLTVAVLYGIFSAKEKMRKLTRRQHTKRGRTHGWNFVLCRMCAFDSLHPNLHLSLTHRGCIPAVLPKVPC